MAKANCPPVPADTAPAAFRTTPELIQGIIETEVNMDLSPFILAANIIVTQVCGCSGYTDGFVGSHMEQLERWIGAHYYTVFDNQLTSARAGTAAVVFQGKTEYGFKSSYYGQMAMRLDTAGNLAALDNASNTRRFINARVIGPGKRRCEGWYRGLFPIDGGCGCGQNGG